MPDVDRIPVAATPSGKDHDPIADGADRSPHRCRVVGSLVLPPGAEDWMSAAAEHAADAAKRDRGAEKCCLQRSAAGIEVFGSARSGVKPDRFQLVRVATTERETGAEDLVDDDRAVRLLEPLDEYVELVAFGKVAAHVDAVLEDVSQGPGELMAGRGRKHTDTALVQRVVETGANDASDSERVDQLGVGRLDQQWAELEVSGLDACARDGNRLHHENRLLFEGGNKPNGGYSHSRHDAITNWSHASRLQSICLRINVGISMSERSCSGDDLSLSGVTGFEVGVLRLGISPRVGRPVPLERGGRSGITGEPRPTTTGVGTTETGVETWWDEDALSRSKPVAITVTRISPCIAGSWTAPKMISASSPTASWMISLIWWTSPRVRSAPPVMLTRTPVAPLIEMLSSRGELMACCADSIARFSPRPIPVPMSAEPPFCMTVLTSAKSTFTRPVTLIRDEMPCVACSRTSSAFLSASWNGMPFPTTASSRSLGTTIIVSTCWCSSTMPCSACRMRLRPSNRNGLVTMPTVSAPASRPSCAITGAAPVPVPPPMPQVTKTRSAPDRARPTSSRFSSIAWRPISGRAPAPSPRVSFFPIWIFTSDFEARSACESVLIEMNSTLSRCSSIMRLTAFPPPPPTPTTFMRAFWGGVSSNSKIMRAWLHCVGGRSQSGSAETGQRRPALSAQAPSDRHPVSSARTTGGNICRFPTKAMLTCVLSDGATSGCEPK